MLSVWFGRVRSAPITVLLFALCIAVFVAAERTGSTTDIDTLLRFGATWRGRVWEGEWWRLFTSMFLHIGWLHLVWNVLAGFRWAAPIEKALGAARYLALYLASGVAGSALSVIGQDAVSAGASGALFGVIGADLVITRGRLGSWRALWDTPQERKKLMSVGLWFLIGPWAGFDNYAHAGGLMVGVALTSAFVSTRRANLVAAAALVVVVTALALRPVPMLHDEWTRRHDAYDAALRQDWSAVLELTRDVEQSKDPLLAEYRAVALEDTRRYAELTPLLPLLSDVEGERSRRLALTLLAKKDFVGARATLATAMSSHPSNRALSLALARVQLEQGDVAAAAETLQPMLAGDADALTSTAWRFLSHAQWRQGEQTEALASLETADRLDDAPSAQRLQVLVALDRADEARALLPSMKASPTERRATECGLALVSPPPWPRADCSDISREALWFVPAEALPETP